LRLVLRLPFQAGRRWELATAAVRQTLTAAEIRLPISGLPSISDVDDTLG